jgi:hypothetical protein
LKLFFAATGSTDNSATETCNLECSTEPHTSRSINGAVKNEQKKIILQKQIKQINVPCDLCNKYSASCGWDTQMVRYPNSFAYPNQV